MCVNIYIFIYTCTHTHTHTHTQCTHTHTHTHKHKHRSSSGRVSASLSLGFGSSAKLELRGRGVRLWERGAAMRSRCRFVGVLLLFVEDGRRFSPQTLWLERCRECCTTSAHQRHSKFQLQLQHCRVPHQGSRRPAQRATSAGGYPHGDRLRISTALLAHVRSAVASQRATARNHVPQGAVRCRKVPQGTVRCRRPDGGTSRHLAAPRGTSRCHSTGLSSSAAARCEGLWEQAGETQAAGCACARALG